VLLQQLVIQQPGQPAKAQQQVGLQIEQQPQVGPLARINNDNLDYNVEYNHNLVYLLDNCFFNAGIKL
jgi:hypothetical protein